MNQKAFTLIELLVVVLIIGILAAIALPQYESAVEKSRAAEAVLNLKQIQQAFVLKNLEDPNFLEAYSNGDITPQDIVQTLSGGQWSSGGSSYCTKYFLYVFEWPEIAAHRSNNITACSNYVGKLYSIYKDVPPEEDWETYKTCLAYTDTGYRVCKGLDGFETEDEREE